MLCNRIVTIVNQFELSSQREQFSGNAVAFFWYFDSLFEIRKIKSNKKII